jgi:hypothetical protein
MTMDHLDDLMDNRDLIPPAMHDWAVQMWALMDAQGIPADVDLRGYLLHRRLPGRLQEDYLRRLCDAAAQVLLTEDHGRETTP